MPSSSCQHQFKTRRRRTTMQRVLEHAEFSFTERLMDDTRHLPITTDTLIKISGSNQIYNLKHTSATMQRTSTFHSEQSLTAVATAASTALQPGAMPATTGHLLQQDATIVFQERDMISGSPQSWAYPCKLRF